jgi:hypothetical protein
MLYIKGDYTLFTYQNTERIVLTRVFVPEKHIFLNNPLYHNLTNPWELYSVSDQMDAGSIASEPPRTWHINIDTIRRCDLPSKWPEPVVSHSNSIFSSEQYYLTLLDNSGNIIFLKIDSLLILIIKESQEIDKKTISALFERTDLIIICTNSTQYAESIRQQFRPRLCISTSLPPSDRPPQSNMVFTSKQECSIECSVSGKKSIKISKIRTK